MDNVKIRKKIKKEYAIAIGVLVGMLVLSQLFLQFVTYSSKVDSNLINESGRQRMLSQKISKAALGVYSGINEEDELRFLEELESSLDLWQNNYTDLQIKRSTKVTEMYEKIEVNYQKVIDASNKIIEKASKGAYQKEELVPFLIIISENEQKFLEGMDQIVLQYDIEANQKITRIQIVEMIILFISLGIIAFESRYIFRPLLKHIVEEIKEEQNDKKILMTEKELFETIIEAVREAFLYIDTSGEILLMNKMAEEYTGWVFNEAREKNYKEVFVNVNLFSNKQEIDPIECVLKNGGLVESPKYEVVVAKNGKKTRITGTAAPVFSDKGDIHGVALSFRDITKELELENEIENFLNINLDMLCVSDNEGHFIKVNNQFVEVLGYDKSELVGENYLNLVHEEDFDVTIKAMEEVSEGTSLSGFVNRYRCKDGSYKYIEWRSKKVDKNTYSSARDVTISKLRENELTTIAIKDKLTNLFNRHYFYDIIGQQMEYSDRYNAPLSILILDLDHFKKVNDTWGHPIGDEVLKMTGELMQNVIRDTDILVRFGGEEFLVLMPKTDVDGALIAAEKIRLTIEDSSHVIAGKITASLGVAERVKAESFRHWYYRVDKALYLAKENGRNQVSVSDKKDELEIGILKIKWEADWESNNKSIDSQHFNILEAGNKLINLCIEGTEQKDIEKQLDLLIELIAYHFSSEIKIIQKLGYMGYKHHAEIHNKLLVKVDKLKELYYRGEVMPSAFYSFIVDDVIIGHMVEEDSKFFGYVADK